ncbi:MAG: hypothetical protein AAGJ68_14555 [Pseudomonadota bacterium]
MSEFIDKFGRFANADDDIAKEQARIDLSEFIKTWGDDPAALRYLVSLGEVDAAMDAVLNDDTLWGGLTKSMWGPSILPFRQHPSFAEVLEDSGLLAHFKATDEIPDECAWVGASLDCTQTLP